MATFTTYIKQGDTRGKQYKQFYMPILAALSEQAIQYITPWPLVRKRTIPTERPPLVDEIAIQYIADINICCWEVTMKQAMRQQSLLGNSFVNMQQYRSHHYVIYTCNNGRIVGSGVFCAIHAEAI
jgi:hypothetical protein